jgi:hypothetical protein
MTAKSFLIVGALALGSLGIASAKSYDFSLGESTMIGQQALKAGEYKVKVEGSEAVFTDVQSGKSFTVSVTIEHNGQKFDRTAVESSTAADGMDKINKIDLGGSDTVIELGN